MQVRMTIDVSGLRDGVPWPKRGEVLECSDAEAVDMLNAKHAEPVEPAAPETAAAPAVKLEKR